MRTTAEQDDDAEPAVDQLIRRGLAIRDGGHPFVQRTEAVGLSLDVSNVAKTLEVLEGTDAR